MWSLLVLGAGASGCAYYNGLYNANQLARQAGVAEREGRRGEARSLWIQVAVKAESVAVKYPSSKYYDDALLMHGSALHAIGDCERALIPLAIAVEVSSDDALVVESRFLQARCWLEIGDADAARDVLDPLAHLVDPSVESRRRFLLGRAALIAGDPGRAWAEFGASREEDAQYQRAVALLALGRVREAASVIDSTRRDPYAERRWQAALQSIAAVDLRVASALVDRLRADGDMTGGEEARLLIADGQRWLRDDDARARTRFVDAAEAAGDSIEAALAVGHLSVLDFRASEALDDLPDYHKLFRAVLLDGGGAVAFVEPFALVVNDIMMELEENTGPFRLFRRAEEVRDSLRAPMMAARVFREVALRYPASVIAPKALLALASLQPARADSVGRVLRDRYPHSSYTKVVLGVPAPDYEAVEDSLRRLLNRFALPGVRGTADLRLSGVSFLPDTVLDGFHR